MSELCNTKRNEDNESQSMEDLSIKHQQFTGQLVQRGYEKAAASMSSLIAQHVRIEKSHVQMSKEPSNALELLKNGAYHTIMVTELMGDLKGESYLVFSEEERATICELSGKVFSPSAQMPEEAILQEIDNIVSASVITEFSNSLNISMFGNVPKLILNEGSTELKYAEDGESVYLLAEGVFVLENHMEIRPKFIWRFDQKLLGHIENSA